MNEKPQETMKTYTFTEEELKKNCQMCLMIGLTESILSANSEGKTMDFERIVNKMIDFFKN